MILIGNESYESAYFKVLEILLSDKYKIENDSKIAHETNACLTFDHLAGAVELKDNKFLSNYNYNLIYPDGNQQILLEFDYYKRLFIDSGQIDNTIKLLGKDPSSKHAVMRVPDNQDPYLPCQIYQFSRILNGQLHTNAHMRANNACGLLLMDMHLNNAIAAHIAKQLGIPAGMYTHFIDSLHIYKEDLKALLLALPLF